MSNSRRRVLATGTALATMLAVPWVRAQKVEKVRMSWLPIMQTTALYVAVQDRLFERAGLDVELVQFQNPNQIIDSLVANQADAGAPGAAAGITTLAESRYPGTFKVFGLQGGGIKVKRINDGLIVKNGSSIRSFKDLRGKTLGHLPGIQWRTISRHMLRASGLDPVVTQELLHVRSRRSEQIEARCRHGPRAAAVAGRGNAGAACRPGAAHLRHGRQGPAQPVDDGPGGVPGVFAARPVDGYRSGPHVLAGRPRGGGFQAGLHRQPDLGLLLHHGVQPRRQSLQQRPHHRRHRRPPALLPQAAPLGAGGALGAGESRRAGLRRAERQQARADHLPRRHVPGNGARGGLQGR